jgi:hypothetical protein
MAFKEPANTACFMCKHVPREHLPVLYVCHDQDDGAWQFLCNVRDHDMGDIGLVALHRATDLDPTRVQVADLPPGFIATPHTGKKFFVDKFAPSEFSPSCQNQP